MSKTLEEFTCTLHIPDWLYHYLSSFQYSTKWFTSLLLFFLPLYLQGKMWVQGPCCSGGYLLKKCIFNYLPGGKIKKKKASLLWDQKLVEFIPEGAHFAIPALLSPTQSSFTLYCRQPAVLCQEGSCWLLLSLPALCCLLLYVHASVKSVAITSVNLSE